MDMPDKIYADIGKDGGTFWFSSPHDAFGKQEPYVKADLAQSLADALEGIMRDLPSNKDWLDPVLEAMAKDALANYRKGE